ncbi:hypothetical protein [Neogemmobacter tilapiae]|uniref:Uncharacterized protein n=1 Tax=Neogemmobacter tilapiae TaxID=875041 RepID=A0A918TQI0_9RHOB|nr:hypothetical protein [Gemmobacter tilapiae]GHC52429.1 hypothetical protein GCM10007315_13640 [Gemmobacter tilapiae]
MEGIFAVPNLFERVPTRALAEATDMKRTGEEELLPISDNKRHPTERVHFGEVTLIGRVAWWGHTNRE